MRTLFSHKKKPYRVLGRGGCIACILLTALTPLGLLLISLARKAPLTVEGRYSLGWYRGVARALCALTGGSAFSWMEVVLLLLGGAAVAYLVCWVIEVLRHRALWWKICLRRLWVIGCVCSAVFFYFILCGDLNYYRQPVGASLGLTTEATDLNTLRALRDLLAKQAAAQRAACTEADDGTFTMGCSYAELADAASAAVTGLDGQFSVELFSPAGWTRPKAMRFSRTMSAIHLTGVIFPYLMEPNINVEQPQYGIGSTMCHELAHICGYMREDEANFISYLACTSSPDAGLQYSGTMLALIHTTNRLSAFDRNAWRDIYEVLGDGILRDLAANSRYWAQFETSVGKTADRVNDAYLKANDQDFGIRSYGRMVDLLIAYYRAAGTL